MKKILITLLLLLSNILPAQVTQEWVATYSGTGSGYNFPKKMTIDFEGNIIVAGNSDSTHGYDYIILKYTPSGNLIWKQRYNGIGNGYDYLSGMVLDDSGNVYVTGSSEEGSSRGGINWVTIKYNSSGSMKWKRSLNWTANLVDENFGMNIDKDRNIYVIGFGRVTSLERAMLTMKYNPDGDSVWCASYTSLAQRSNWGYSVVTDDSDNVYSSGYGAVPTGNEIVTIKYDSGGQRKWVKTAPTGEGDYLRPVFSAVDSSNNIVVVGYSYFSNNYDFQTLKYSSAGDLLWSRTYNGGNIDRANCLFIDNYSNILIAGFTFINTYGDYLILKYSSAGETLLMKNFNGESSGSTDEAFAILSDKNGNIYLTGYSQALTNGYEFLTMKLNTSGGIIWAKKYSTGYDSYAYFMVLDKAGSIYVSGECFQAGGNTVIVTVKYSQLTGITKNEINENENLLINYPNPFNSNTEIEYKIGNNALVRIKIYDIQGKEIETLVNENKNIGNYKINFNGDKYSSGIYFYSLQIDNKIIQTNRMLIIK